MISKQRILLILIAVIILSITFLNLSWFTPEKRNYEVYTQALNKYNHNNFSDAYYAFGQVSSFSKLRSAAVYRQALCAEKLLDSKTEIKKYKEIIKSYPDTKLALRARYLKAQLIYESGDYKKAKKEFLFILKKMPDTDYAIAAKYFLGSIEVENATKIKNLKRKQKTQSAALQYFKSYLKEAPNGRFAIKCIKKWIGMNTRLNNEDNLLIAKIYQKNQDYQKAQNYLRFTNLNSSWPYLVSNAYAIKDFSKVKYYTENGLKGSGESDILINENKNRSSDNEAENKDIYEAIDQYLKLNDSPRLSISYLLSIAQKSNGYDYLLYKNCTNLPINNQIACYNSLYYKYPNGQFAAEALSNIFYAKIKDQQYAMAKNLGRVHLTKFGESNSAPKVMFWLAKVSEKTKNYEDAKAYYRTILRKYPDDYYAYHAFLNLNRYRNFQMLGLENKPVEFPYANSDYALIKELAKVQDYGLINQLCKDDEFIQSWLAYLEGDFSTSARIARDAMDKLTVKPPRTDLRWRLVYPLHYYDAIRRNSQDYNNDPVLILSIIREESYFNPKAQSAVGARGLMQLMPSTAREASSMAGLGEIGDSRLFDPDTNIRLGNIYYYKLKNALITRDFLAVLAYNGGIGSVSRWREGLNYVDSDDFVEQIPYAETQNYLKKVYKSYWNYLRVYSRIKF